MQISVFGIIYILFTIIFCKKKKAFFSFINPTYTRNVAGNKWGQIEDALYDIRNNVHHYYFINFAFSSAVAIAFGWRWANAAILGRLINWREFAEYDQSNTATA